MKLSGVSDTRKQTTDYRSQKAVLFVAIARSFLLCFSIFMQTQTIPALFTTRDSGYFFSLTLKKIPEWAEYAEMGRVDMYPLKTLKFVGKWHGASGDLRR